MARSSEEERPEMVAYSGFLQLTWGGLPQQLNFSQKCTPIYSLWAADKILYLPLIPVLKDLRTKTLIYSNQNYYARTVRP